jgi:hypothetical protein
MTRLSDDLRRLADTYEAAALPGEVVVARLRGRMRTGRTMAAAGAVAAGIAVLTAVVVLRVLLPGPNAGAPVLPPTVGIFQTIAPDGSGRCLAVRLYDTTAVDGRVALWAWTGAGGCATRTSNLVVGTGTASAIALPAAMGLTARAGIQVTFPTGVAAPLAGAELVLDPLASSTDTAMSGFRSLADVGGPHTLELTRVASVVVPYVVP